MVSDEFIISTYHDRIDTFTLRIPKETSEQINNICIRTNRSRNDIINRALAFALERLKIEEE